MNTYKDNVEEPSLDEPSHEGGDNKKIVSENASDTYVEIEEGADDGAPERK